MFLYQRMFQCLQYGVIYCWYAINAENTFWSTERWREMGDVYCNSVIMPISLIWQSSNIKFFCRSCDAFCICHILSAFCLWIHILHILVFSHLIFKYLENSSTKLPKLADKLPNCMNYMKWWTLSEIHTLNWTEVSSV